MQKVTRKMEDEGFRFDDGDETMEEEEREHGAEEQPSGDLDAVERPGAEFRSWCPKNGETPCLPLFPRKSVNLVSAPSNTGKTTLLQNILRYRQHFFDSDGVKGLIYVNCSASSSIASLENPFEEFEKEFEVLVFALGDVEDVDSLLKEREGYVVILDDVVAVGPVVDYFVTYATNHGEVTLFLVTQSLLANKKLYSLIYKVHTLTLFFGNSYTPPLVRQLLKDFVLDEELKRSLKAYFGKCETNRLTCLVKLNAPASSPPAYKKVRVFSGINQLFSGSRGYCVVYPEPNQAESLQSFMEFGPEVDGETLVLVKAKFVKRRAEEEGDQQRPSGSESARDKSKWSSMYKRVLEDLKLAFHVKKWKQVVSLFKEILRIDDFILGSKQDGYKTLIFKSDEETATCSLVDLINLLVRRSHPFEKIENYIPFVPFIRHLLKRNVPQSFIKNKKALELGLTRGKIKLPKKEAKYERKRQESQAFGPRRRGEPLAKRRRSESEASLGEGYRSGEFSEVSD